MEADSVIFNKERLRIRTAPYTVLYRRCFYEGIFSDCCSFLMSIAFGLLDFVLTLGLNFANSPELKRSIQVFCKIIIWICTIIWAGLFVLCCIAAVDLALKHQWEDAVKLVVTASLLAAAIYFLVVRKK